MQTALYSTFKALAKPVLRSSQTEARIARDVLSRGACPVT